MRDPKHQPGGGKDQEGPGAVADDQNDGPPLAGLEQQINGDSRMSDEEQINGDSR